MELELVLGVVLVLELALALGQELERALELDELPEELEDVACWLGVVDGWPNQ